MNKQDWIIVYLSVTLALVQLQLYRSIKSQAYAEGRLSVIYVDSTSNTNEGTCFVKNGCK